MNLHLKKTLVILILMGTTTITNADTCTSIPGSVTCGSGVVAGLMGNGMVNVDGTTINGAAVINGQLNAEGAHFVTLEVMGSANLSQCTVSDVTDIKGSLTALATDFQRNVDIYSTAVRFSKSNITGDVHVHHSDSEKQIVYLDKMSVVSGNIIFDDGDGKVIVRGHSKIKGKVIGGHVSRK